MRKCLNYLESEKKNLNHLYKKNPKPFRSEKINHLDQKNTKLLDQQNHKPFRSEKIV
jgi:hypothetical protein